MVESQVTGMDEISEKECTVAYFQENQWPSRNPKKTYTQATGINLRPPQSSLQSEWNSKLEEKFQNMEEKNHQEN